ncbi:MAG: sigma-70 family RNA polymerase sigma factor [Flavobacteriales bacterium]|nr:MAG: sigma-70 family RNA polymerase sigma factor [Flavobacteriales bacterium]
MRAKTLVMSDTELLNALRDGRAEQAFTQLYRHLPDVMSMVRTHGGSRSDARDLFQDALVILHEKAQDTGFIFSGSLGAYVYGICRNLWLAEIRLKGKARKYEEALLAQPNNQQPSTTHPQDELLMQLAERAFAALGDKCRDLLTRFYLRNEPLAAIAQAFGYAGEGAAKTRKYKCLEQAREKYRTLLSNNPNLHSHA